MQRPSPIRRLLVLPWCIAFAVPVAAQQAPSAGLYRMIQAGAEVARETFRRTASGHELSVVIPVVDLRIDSRTEYDAGGRFARFESQVSNLAGDSVRATWSIAADGDTLRVVRVRPLRGDTTRRVAALRVDGILPAQSMAIVPILAARYAGRDTTLRFLPMGADSTIPVTLTFRGDSTIVTMASVTAYLTGSGAGPVEVPTQRVQATLWNGRDSLAPLSGMRRPAPDYTAPAGAPYAAIEARVPITAGGDTFSLAGTLTLPSRGRGPYPVIVTISGSGQQTRDEDLWPTVRNYRPFREIAERLAQEGIAVFRYDDRGIGGSSGPFGTTAEYTDDVRKIVAWLRTRRDVDGRRVGLLGHSEGAVMAPLVAADDPALGPVVLMAGPSKSGRAIVRYQLRYPIVTARGLSAADRERQLVEADSGVAQWARSNPWAQWLADYDPLVAARKVRQPVLILQGALDQQVTAEQADTLAAAIRAGGNRDVTVRVYLRLNHLFLPSEADGAPAEYVALKQTNLPQEVLDDLARWVGERFRARRR